MALTSEAEHLDAQRDLILAALAMSRRGDWLKVLRASQVKAAMTSMAYLPGMLDEQGIDGAAVATVQVAPLLDRTGSGYPAAMAHAHSPTQMQKDRLMRTILQDTARQVMATGMAARPAVSGYVRTLEGASCARCVILAGKWYRWNQGFQRHPRCDCRHLPANRNEAQNPRDIFDAMTAEEQDLRFGKAGAEAIRMGADMSLVVNARRGIQTSQVLGRTVKTTTVLARGGVRLMPETILAEAETREHAIALLRRYGYLT